MTSWEMQTKKLQQIHTHTHTHKKQLKHNTKNGHQTQENKRGREEKNTYKTQPKTIKKMALGIYISMITLNVNELNAPTKRHRLADWIQKQTHIYVVYKRPTLDLGTHTD